IHQDISCDLPGSRLCRFNCLDRRPALLELVFTEIGHALGVDLEPLIDPLWAREFLLDVSSLVAKVQNHAIFNSLIEFVGVDVGAEGLNTGSLILLKKRCAGKADEHRIRQQFLHRTVKLAALGTVSLIDEDEEIAFRTEPLEQGLLELTNEVFGLALILLVITPEFMYQ